MIQTEFIPSVTGGITSNKEEIKSLLFPPKLGGLGIPIFAESFQVAYENSVKPREEVFTKSRQSDTVI